MASARTPTGDGDWVNASSDVSMLNEKLYNRQRIDTFHTPSKLIPSGSAGVTPDRRSPEPPTERPTSTPLSDGREYGHRLVDLVNSWNEDTRRMLREELAANGTNSKPETPLPPMPREEELSPAARPQILQSILQEIRALASLAPARCNCGALDRVAVAQEELSEIVRGHLLVERAASVNSRREESAAPSESMQAMALQPLLAELTSAFGEMQQALKESAALVEEVRQQHAPPERENQRPERSPFLGPELDVQFMMQDLQQIKDMLSRTSSTETLLAAEVQLLKETLHDVQQKSEKDSQTILKTVEKLTDVVAATATTHQDETAAVQRQNQRILDTVQHLAELVSIDHRKAQEDASVVRQSIGLLEAEMKLIKESMATSLRQSNQELIERLRILEDSVTANHQEAEQKYAARLDVAHGSQAEQIERKAELHSHAVGDVKQEVLLLKDEIVKCHEKLEKAPKQLALTEAVRRTFEQLTKDFHEECTQLYMKPSFQVSFPDTLNQDLREIKEAMAEEKRRREDTKVKAIAELGRLEQEFQKTEQGVQGLECTVKEQLVPELQHLQDIFAMLEGNFLITVRKQLDKATAAFSSTTAHFKSSLKKDMEITLKEASKANLRGQHAMLESRDNRRVANGPRLIELVVIFLSVAEFAMHMTNAFLELQSNDRFLLALAAVLGPCLLNSVVIVIFVNYLSSELQRWINSNWSHSQRFLAMGVLRPDCLRFFGLLVPQLRSSCSTWERRYWEEVLQANTAQLQQECDELRLALHSEEVQLPPRPSAEVTARSDGKDGQDGQDVEVQPPAVPVHLDGLHGAPSPGGQEVAGSALGMEESQAALEVVAHLQRHHPSPSASPRGPKPVLRNREWDDWLRSQGLEKRRGDEGVSSNAKELFRPSGVRKVYKWKPHAAAAGQGGSVARPLVNPRQLPHSCLLCGMAPNSEKKTVSVYRKFMSQISLASALYNDVPKVVLSVWLLSLNDRGSETVILRVTIIVISGMYILWALLHALITQLEETCGWRLPDRAGPPIDTGIEDAVVEVSSESLTVSWSCPLQGLSAQARPKDFVCTVQPLGQSESSIMRRVSLEDGELCCTFGALQADTAYVVKLAASRKGVLLGRPVRISCRTLPLPLAAEPESLSLRSCGPSWAEIAWSGAFTEQLLELRQHGVAGTLLRREVAGPEPVHCIWGLRPNTEYEVGLKLPGDEKEPTLKLSFVTSLEEEESSTNVFASLTTLLKDLGSVKEMVSSLDAAAASAELTRQLGGLQDRWASLQVSCLTEEIQKLMNSNQQLKSDISNEMKPVFSELRRIQDALTSM